jgi:hypothetical protein
MAQTTIITHQIAEHLAGQEGAEVIPLPPIILQMEELAQQGRDMLAGLDSFTVQQASMGCGTEDTQAEVAEVPVVLEETLSILTYRQQPPGQEA